MSIKKSLVNRGLIESDFKRYWFIILVGILGAVFLVFTKISGNYEAPHENILMNFRYAFENMKFVMIGIGAGVSLLIFAFKNKRESSEFIFSQPISKKSIYISKILSGTILITITWAIIALIGTVIMMKVRMFDHVAGGYFTRFMFIGFFQGILSFFCCTAVGMATSNTIATGILAFFWNLLMLGFLESGAPVIENWIMGYSFSDGFTGVLIKIQDFISSVFFFKIYRSYHTWEWWWFLGSFIFMTFIYFILGYVLLKRRENHKAGDVIVFSWVKILVKLGFAFFFAMVGLQFLGDGYGYNHLFREWIRLIIFVLVAWVLSSCIIKKSLKFKFRGKFLKVFLIFIGITGLVFISIENNAFGIGHVGLNRADVEQVHLHIHSNGKDNFSKELVLEGEKIEMAFDLCEKILEDKKALKPTGDRDEISIYVHFTKAHGGERVRRYRVNYGIRDKEFFNDIFMMKEM